MAEEFVNRRGKRTTVTDEHMVSAVTETHVKPMPQRKKWRPSKKISTWLHRWPRMGLRSTVVAMVALLLFGVIVLVSADSAKRRYESLSVAMKNSITAAGSSVPSTDKKASDVAGILLASLSASTACTVSGIDVVSWYGPAKTARDDCRQTAERYTRLRSELATMRSYAEYLERVYTIVAPALAQPADGAYAIAGDYVDAWTTSTDQLRTIVPPSQFMTTHTTFTQRSEELRDAWVALQAALTTRDATAFTSSESKLTKAYDNFRAAAGDIQTILQKQQELITASQSIPL
ncbi:MAG: hypothetical protein WBB39_01785 [Candidatus Saccharimonadales bacterium]